MPSAENRAADTVDARGRRIPADVICLSTVDWDFVWQGQQEVMVRLARLGSRVLYVENTGVRGPRIRDLGRIVRRLGRWSRAPLAPPARAPSGIRVHSPLVAPYPWKPATRALNRMLFVRPLRHITADFRDPLIWTFLPTPTVLDAIAACRGTRSVIVYYCVADFAELVDDVEALRVSEVRLLRDADLVFVNGEGLRRRFARVHNRVRTFPFGVDTEAFAARTRLPEPLELAAIPRPRVGYIGGLHRHLALDWLTHAARLLPEVAFVFVGPEQTNLGELPRLPNVHLLGQRPHSQLPAYVGGFDVCLVPYVLTAYTASVVPTKLFEYLAMGRPVVTTALPEVKALGLPEGAVEIARGPRGFAEAIQGVLAGGSSEAAEEERRRFARRYSWDVLFDAMLDEIASVGPERHPRA